MENIVFATMEFDAKQMIRLLGNDLYDSPLAMLRENIQNAYDAILERQLVDKEFSPVINIEIFPEKVIIADNGTGMNESILINNYWKAGNSSKNTPEAIEAGVVGHFGIGALANFGVCKELEIETRRFNEDCAYYATAIRDDLNKKNSIPIKPIPTSELEPGTKIIATLDIPNSVTKESAIEYLRPYIEYLDIPVFINNERFPKRTIDFDASIDNYYVEDELCSYKLRIGYSKSIPLKVNILAYDIVYIGTKLDGYIYLNNDEEIIWGLRNGFGLSTLNIFSEYNLGGVANLRNLIPTAGREAVSRASTNTVSVLIDSIEKQWSKLIAKDPICDKYSDFIRVLSSNFKIDQAKLIKIKLANEDKSIELGSISSNTAKKYKFADGVDKTILTSLKNSPDCILSISDNTYRKRVQRKYLQQFNVESIPNSIQILKEYSEDELSIDQLLIISEIKKIIEEDYYVNDFDLKFADISHLINVYVTHDLNLNRFCIYISHKNSDIMRLMDIRKEHYHLFTPIAKDFVRVVLYQQFSTLIPKGIKERTDYINNVLARKKDEYVIPYEMTGPMDELIGKLEQRIITPEEFVKLAKTQRNKHQQTINKSQIGDVSEVIANINSNVFNKSADAEKNVQTADIMPMPPIFCMDVSTNMRILKTDTVTPVLQNHIMFMALTDRVVNQKRIFFTNPHTTKVIWSMHRLIYIFSDITGKNTLYYDLELKNKIPDSTGGAILRSTTIITKDKIFVPIVPELYEYFNLRVDDKLKFLVHFDEITN